MTTIPKSIDIYKTAPLSQIPPGSLTITRWQLIKKGLLALSIFLAVFTIAELAARYVVYWVQPMESHARHYDQIYQLIHVTKNPSRDSIILIGNSHISLGVYPELLERRLSDGGIKGLKVFNFASPGNSPWMSLALLKEAIQEKHRPKLVVFNVAKNTFYKVNDSDVAAHRKETNFRKSYLHRCVLNKPAGLSKKFDCQAGRLSYLYRHRSFFKDEILKMADVARNPEQSRDLNANPVQTISPQGWLPQLEFNPGKRQWANPPNKKRVNKLKAGSRKPPLVYSRQEMDELVRFTKEHHLPLMLVWMPHYCIKPPCGTYEGEINRIRQYAVENGLLFSNLAYTIPGDSLFIDRTHLNAAGGIYFTEKFSEELLKPTYRKLFE